MKLSHVPAAVVFDMDGLLFDTEALYQEAFTLAAFDWGYDMPSPVFLSMVGSPPISFSQAWLTASLVV